MRKEEDKKPEIKWTPVNPKALEEQLDAFRKAEIKFNQIYGTISGIRLVVFCIAVIGFLIALAAQQWWGWLLAGTAVIGFIVLLLRHMEIGNTQTSLKHLIQVYERYQSRMQGTWQTFPDTGIEFQQEQDFVSDDLDVFGTASLYQMLCVAHTPTGRRRLAEVLQQQEVSLEIIEQRQLAVAELAEKSQFSLCFEAVALGCAGENREEHRRGESERAEENKKENSLKEKESNPARFSGVLRVLAWVYPLGFLLCIAGAALQWWSWGIVPVLFFTALLFSWVMSGYCQRKVGKLLSHSRTLQNYLYMLDALASEAFDTEHLKQLQNVIRGEGDDRKSLIMGLKKLERLLGLYNIRFNPIAHWLLSGICLYDFHLAAYAVSWQQQYGSHLKEGITALGEVEMLSSLAVLERIRPVSYPTFYKEDMSPAFHMEQVCHPLLKPETAVPNSISMKQESVVITGSNMSGKTTFLRTIGLNLILAYAGAPVCALEFSASRMRLFTSMRVVDDVQHGISTFYAEILRIKEMVEYGKREQPMLCLIDEIFKGTNSADRIVGAEAVIRKLSRNYIITIVSTHDFELCKLAENYHFEESYEENQIVFDYKLKQGICTTTNALYLLKMAGLTE